MRVAIVGYGVMGHHHARICKALGHEVTTCDPFSPEADAERMWTCCEEFDAAIVAAPIQELVPEAIRAGDVRLLIEKPGAEEYRSLVIGLFDKDAWFGYVERFNPVVRELQERIGEVVTVKTERLGPAARSDVSPAIDLATHDLDILASLGLDTTPIVAMQRGGHLSALLECGTLEASHASPIKSRKITIYGAPHLHADLIEQRLWVDGMEISVSKHEPLMAQDAAFLRGEPCPVSIEQAAETLRIAEQLEAMCETDRSDPIPTSSTTSLAA